MDKPILFSAPMVRAILEGRKTQTRRVITGYYPSDTETFTWMSSEYDKALWYPSKIDNSKGYREFKELCRPIKCPFGNPGDRLWVRENWAVSRIYDGLPPREIQPGAKVAYPASGDVKGLKLRPSIHMPRWASRITLQITTIRVERVQDITYEDATQEGVYINEYMDLAARLYGSADKPVDAVDYFHVLWDSINAPRGYGWDANPWVWVVEFKQAQKGGNE